MKQILFNQDMVRAILTCAKCGKMSVPVPCCHCGSTEFIKSQTRRPMKVQPLNVGEGGNASHRKFVAIRADGTAGFTLKPPFQVNTVRWVRERARLIDDSMGHLKTRVGRYEYAVDSSETNWVDIPRRLKPVIVGNCVPNGCFKELARIFIKPVRVWAERVQDITIADALSEGITDDVNTPNFATVWNSCYPGSWDRNDWCWCCEFERCKRE